MNSCLHTWAIAYGGNGRWVYDPLDNLREADQGARQFRYFYNDTGPSPTWRLASIKNPGGTTLNSFAYDVRGNTLQRNAGDAFTFDRANRLLTATLGASSYRYDALGRRAQQIAGGITTRYQYSRAGQLLQSDESSPARHHTYIYLSGSLVAKRTVPASGPVQVRYQHTDGLGSLVAASDESAVVVRRERMTAYGEPADGGWANGHGYTGHQNDAATELVYMQQRYYDPAIGRFLSVDPISANVESGNDFNRYQYASSNPYKYVDPDGRQACLPSSGLQPRTPQGNPCVRPPENPWGGPGGTELGSKEGGDDHDPEADYNAERKAFFKRVDETFTAAAKSTAKEAGLMAAGGPIGKMLGKIARAVGIARAAGKIEVKMGHALRRFPEWEHNEITSGVTAHISRRGAPAAGETIQETIIINGKQYSYRAFGGPGGTTSVGTIVEGTFSRNVAKPRP